MTQEPYHTNEEMLREVARRIQTDLDYAHFTGEPTDVDEAALQSVKDALHSLQVAVECYRETVGLCFYCGKEPVGSFNERYLCKSDMNAYGFEERDEERFLAPSIINGVPDHLVCKCGGGIAREPCDECTKDRGV